MPNGDVTIQVIDNGSASINVPAQSTQLVIGCGNLTHASAAVANYQIVATRQPSTLLASFGPTALAEAAALSTLAGGTVLAMSVPVTTKGTATAAVLSQGTGASLGTASPSVAVDGTQGAYDDYFVVVRVVVGGALGTAGITLQFSLDAGRNYGPIVALGTALTYTIPSTGMVLTLGAGAATLVTGNLIKFMTTGPAWAIADIQTALAAFKASPYSNADVGSIHIVGGGTGGISGTGPAMSSGEMANLSNGSTGTLDTLTASYLFERAIVTLRDASGPAAFGGSAESESAWMTAIGLLSSPTTGNNGLRVCPNAGYYNMPSAFPLALTGSSSYRRPLAWSLAAREVAIPPQRHAGRVKDRALSTIVVNPASDPLDGFIYHDELVNPGIDAMRITSARTRRGLGVAFYIVNPNLSSTPGSAFTLLPLGLVMDRACAIVHEVGQEVINEDVRLNTNGTLVENDAKAIEDALGTALKTRMVAVNMISSFTVVVDRTTNVRATSTVLIAVTLNARGYVLQETISISFLSEEQAS
jgi:hypothetical protein